jgi:signal transduction histidine kinase
MLKPRDLRERVALFFAGFGALLSIVLALVVYQTAHDLGRRLIDETMTAELDDYIARRERNPNSLPPSTVVLQGYVRDGSRTSEVPAYLADLPLGWHDVAVDKLSYRVAIIDRNNARFYLLHDTSLQARREERFLLLLGFVVLAATLLSALGGAWVSRAAVAPLSDLTARVRHRGVEDDERPLADDFPDGEIGELARVFDRHLLRMRAFIERERAFNSDMSHELRTSLAVILSTTEILVEDPLLTQKQQDRIARIDRAARDMAELGTALLLMAREDGMLGTAEGCIVANVIEHAVDRHRHLLAHKPVQVDMQLDETVELATDPALVDILVSNLIRNAFTYTENGSVSIRQDRIGIRVADTGRGMSEQLAKQAFIRHFRDMTSLGSGIGLSLVKRICDQYGWQVHLESREGAGTSVIVRFL